MKHSASLLAAILLVLIHGCGGTGTDPAQSSDSPAPSPEGAASEAPEDEGHEHAEEPLATVAIGDLEVELAQGHGGVVAGKEAHLVVKLPYPDQGSTIVSAWLGSEDRTLSYVGKGEYAASHDDYDIHASAPDPLPEDQRWWIEIEQPDGSRLLGSAQPILE